jgi:hypothetical protein
MQLLHMYIYIYIYIYIYLSVFMYICDKVHGCEVAEEHRFQTSKEYTKYKVSCAPVSIT